MFFNSCSTPWAWLGRNSSESGCSGKRLISGSLSQKVCSITRSGQNPDSAWLGRSGEGAIDECACFPAFSAGSQAVMGLPRHATIVGSLAVDTTRAVSLKRGDAVRRSSSSTTARWTCLWCRADKFDAMRTSSYVPNGYLKAITAGAGCWLTLLNMVSSGSYRWHEHGS